MGIWTLFLRIFELVRGTTQTHLIESKSNQTPTPRFVLPLRSNAARPCPHRNRWRVSGNSLSPVFGHDHEERWQDQQ